MALSTQPYKGARDFYPEDKRLQKYIFSVMRRVAESYGYEEYDAPILELTELFVSKTSDEIVDEQTYTFIDRGGRSVTIRPEMTPSVTRMVAAKRQQLVYPLRWYSIPNFWRYERPQRGRLREFWQLNIDVFGVADIQAEVEVIEVADAIMQAFGAKRSSYTIKLNSRKLIDKLIKDILGLDQVQASTLIHLIDKLHKMDYAEFAGQVEGLFNPAQRDKSSPQQLLDFLKLTSLDELPTALQSVGSVEELKQLIKLLTDIGVTNIEFDPSLMRGFDYYNDIVFEVFDNHPDNNRSMFGGGRYDGLIAQFDVEPVPTVGFGMGDVTLANFLELHELMPVLNVEADIFAILIGDVYKPAQKVIAELREMGVNVVMGSVSQKTEKQLKTAVKKNIRYALFIGNKELDSEQFVLRNLASNSEEKHSLQRVVSIVKDFRKS
ncbi:MAG TPA: histidine--tRNA ligase [Candidatus Saccharimonadales bacterium]|nr:histidine--tRNA ligase [Candidatus Saccharimonadales bacterium]